VATSAFPRLSAAHSVGDHDAYRATLATATRTVLLLSALAAAALVAGARPAAEVIAAISSKPPDPAALAWAIAAFAPGLVGYGLLALLSRALYAAGVARAAAVVTLGGWAVVAAGAVALALSLPARDRVAALAAGHTIGMTVLGVALVVLTVRSVGALSGVGRAVAVAVAAGVVAAAAGLAVAAATPSHGVVGSLGECMLVGVVVLVAFAAVAAAGDRDGVRPLLRRAAGRFISRSAPTEGDGRE
jgi:putative peptidoglycan lipid II flippase